MHIFSRSSLAHKMTLMALLASGLAVGTLAASFLVFDGMSSRAALHARLSTLADVVGQNSAATLSFNDAGAAVEVLAALRAEAPVVSACLYDAGGHLFAQYQRQPGERTCAAEGSQLSAAANWYASVSRPVVHHGESVGTLYVNSDQRELHLRRNRLLGVAGFLLVLALGVGGVAASLLQQKISQPVFDLARAMEDVTATENFSARVEVQGSDEIAQLSTGFNTMLAEIERRKIERKRTEELQVQALTDALTGLPNRRLFADRLSQTISLAEREKRTVAVLYIDLDGFKLMNDSLGHSIGDALLVQVAARLQDRVRESDTLARLSGDEFTIILSSLNKAEEGGTVAKALLDYLATPFDIEGHQLMICASIGISVYPDNATDVSTLMRQADTAMYAAKRNGKNQAKYFTPELDSLVRERLSLENELRGAINRGEIQVYYQPEFDVVSGRLVRFEALARWLHPTLGMIRTSSFR
jgi:diguanylate cyclase (GGDEF)-like protein